MWRRLLVKFGAVCGLTSVILVMLKSQPRIFYTMAKDGLLPSVFATVHPKLKTPWVGTILLGAFIAVAAAFLPIDLLGDLVSLGTALAFAIVCLSVIYLRIKHPEMERPFRVPGGIVTAVLGIVFCLALTSFNLWPMVEKAMHHDPLPLTILSTYCLVGAVIYGAYGVWHSKLAKGVDILDTGPGPNEAFAPGHGDALNR